MLPHPQAVCYSEQFSEELNRSYRHCALFGENTETIQTIVINGTAETPGQAVTINLHTKRRFHEGFQFQPFVSFSLAGDMCSAASRVESASVSSASENKIRDWVNQEFKKNLGGKGHQTLTCLTCVGACSLEAYSVGLLIWNMVKDSHAWVPTAWGPPVSGYGSGIWQSIHLPEGLQLGDLQSRATDLESGKGFTCMGAYSLGAYTLGLRI